MSLTEKKIRYHFYPAVFSTYLILSFESFWLMIDWLYLSLQLHNFKRHLAQLIGELDDSVAAEEDAIISKVKNITRDYRDVKAVGDWFCIILAWYVHGE